VFPHADDPPALGPEYPVGLTVALDIAGQFLPPPVRVVPRGGPVPGTRVPEATVHEHRDSVPDESNVDRPAGSRDRSMETEPKAPRPQLSPDGDLG
jgi:hypothetical protein